MSIKISISEKEILAISNNSDLGEMVRNRLWEEQRNRIGPPVDDKHFFLDIAEDGTVKRIIRPDTCSICGKNTSEVEYDYLVGCDHLECVLKTKEKDNCVICGEESPYLRSTNIYERIGYVEGGGQGCFQPNICNQK